MSKLSLEIAPYREQKTGAVTGAYHPADHSCDNGLLFSSYYLLILSKQKDLEPGELESEISWFQSLVAFCQHPNDPGILCRYPGWFGPGKGEQHDDYRGVIAVAKEFKIPSLTIPILNHGEKNSWCWNTEDPNRFDPDYWFGRYPGFVASLRSSAGECLDWPEQLSFALSCLSILSEKASDTTGTLLQWLATRSCQDQGLIPLLSTALWRRTAQKKWPGGLSQVFSTYFYSENHPLARYSPKDFN